MEVLLITNDILNANFPFISVLNHLGWTFWIVVVRYFPQFRRVLVVLEICVWNCITLMSISTLNKWKMYFLVAQWLTQSFIDKITMCVQFLLFHCVLDNYVLLIIISKTKISYTKRWKKRMTQIHYFPLEIAFIKSCDLRLICPFVNMRYVFEVCESYFSLNLNYKLYHGLIFYSIVFTLNSHIYNFQWLFQYFDSFSLWFSMPVCFKCVFYAIEVMCSTICTKEINALALVYLYQFYRILVFTFYRKLNKLIICLEFT